MASVSAAPPTSASTTTSKNHPVAAAPANSNNNNKSASIMAADPSSPSTKGGGSAAIASTTAEQNISYSAERIIGNGSFGVVFEAKVVETGEVVAIKKVLQDKRFKNRELQIMRQLVKDPHPNIVALKHCFYSQVRFMFWTAEGLLLRYCSC